MTALRIIIFFLLPLSVVAQKPKNNFTYFGKSFEIGSSATLILENDDFAAVTRYRELSWNTNVKMRLSKRFWIGMQMVPIFIKSTKSVITKKENFNFYGVILQADVYQSKIIDIFLESSFNRSDMVLLPDDRPLKQEGINYIGFGGGLSMCLNHAAAKNFFLELGFYNYLPLNKIELKSNYTQYIIGLNYRFGKK